MLVEGRGRSRVGREVEKKRRRERGGRREGRRGREAGRKRGKGKGRKKIMLQRKEVSKIHKAPPVRSLRPASCGLEALKLTCKVS